MTQLLDAVLLKQNDVNPFIEESQRSVPALYWVIDLQTQRPVACWRLEVKAAANHA